MSSELADEPYTNSSLGFSIVPPKGWCVREIRPIVLFCPPGRLEDPALKMMGVFGPDISLMVKLTPMVSVTVLPSDMTLNQIVEKVRMGELGPLVRDARLSRKVISERRRTVNDLDAHEYVYTLRSGDLVDELIPVELLGLPPKPPSPTLMVKEVCLVEKGSVCFIGCFAQQRDFAQYLPVFEKSIETFRVREPSVEALIQDLKDGEDGVRGYAAFALGQIGEERSVEPLIQTLGDKVMDVRKQAAEALRKIGEPAIEPLVEALKNANSDVRSAAAWVLGRPPKEERAVEPLIEALRDESSDVRSVAASSLGEIGDVRAFEPLIQALEDGKEDVRSFAAEALGKIGDERAVEPIVQTLMDEDRNVRGNAAWALGEVGDVRAVGPLIKGLRDKDYFVRGRAAAALGKLGDARAGKPLVEALKDKDDPVRKEAAWALGRIGDVGAVEPLGEALQDESSDVRKRAAEALGSIGDARAVRPLARALDDWRVRKEAAEALGKLGKPAVEPLVQALGHADRDVRKAAAEALDTMGWKPVDDAEKARYLVARKEWDDLVRLGRPAIGPLIQVLEDVLVRSEAADALRRIGEPAVEPLSQALKSKDWSVRYHAEKVLEEIKRAREKGVK